MLMMPIMLVEPRHIYAKCKLLSIVRGTKLRFFKSHSRGERNHKIFFSENHDIFHFHYSFSVETNTKFCKNSNIKLFYPIFSFLIPCFSNITHNIDESSWANSKKTVDGEIHKWKEQQANIKFKTLPQGGGLILK